MNQPGRRSALDADLRPIITSTKPFISLVIAVALAAMLLSAFPAIKIKPTELAYFLLTPWFAVNVVRHRALFVGTVRAGIGTALILGMVGAALLYSIDLLIHVTLYGSTVINWFPAQPDIVLLACAAALVETMIVQVGLQSRFPGWPGVLIATAAFTIIHVSLNPLFVAAGFVCALIQYYTGRPGGTFIAHLAYNGLISAFPPTPG